METQTDERTTGKSGKALKIEQVTLRFSEGTFARFDEYIARFYRRPILTRADTMEKIILAEMERDEEYYIDFMSNMKRDHIEEAKRLAAMEKNGV